jgi:cysteine desulfurase / selenocysteine lyase
MRPACLPGVRERVVGVEALVPLRSGALRPYLNLDNAASTPALREVVDAVTDGLQWYASVHRGAGHKSQVATAAFEAARETVARFVGAGTREHVVIFGKNTTEAINKLSHRLPLQPGDVVLVSTLEHHSNDLPWRARATVRHIAADARGDLDMAHYEALLAQHAGRVKLVAVTGGSNVTGSLPEVHRMAALAHAAGAQILVDAAQLAAHRPIDMRPLADPAHLDYLALSGHKLYAPFGVGALVGRRDSFEQGEPEQRGGGTIRFVSLDAVSWADAPERDEAGTPNVLGAVALAAAMRALQGIGLETIAAHEAALTAYTLQRLREVPGLQLYGCADPARAAQRLGVLPFNLHGLPHERVAALLAEEHGIGLRNGCFCAHPYVAHLLGLSAAQVRQLRARAERGPRDGMPGLLRASLGLYNTADEVDQFVAALKTITRGAARPRAEVLAAGS